MFVDLEKLKNVLSDSWSEETCFPWSKNKWSKENPALGQCAVTALIVQDYFWGQLLHCLHAHHYRNRLPEWHEVDFTKEQFPERTEICEDGVKLRDEMLYGESADKAKTLERYKLLGERVEQELLLI